MTDISWRAGDHVLLRGAWRGRVWYAFPVAVVQDTSALMALYLRAGTGIKFPHRRIAPQDMLSAEQIVLVDRVWEKSNVLMLAVPGAAHSVWLMWNEGYRDFSGWYINLQDPLRRTSVGFDTMDRLLDVVPSLDRREWHWKDENDFAKAEMIGVYSADEARTIRKQGQRAIELFQADGSPYSDDWKTWVPPAEWETPTLPPGWDRVAISDSLA